MSHITLSPRCGRPRRWSGVVAFAFVVLAATGAYAQPPDLPAQPIATFEHATHDYALMHRRLERLVGPIEFRTPVDEINRRMQRLAAAIRAERADARQGDFFTPPLSRLLRARIHEALTEHRYSVDDARTSSRVDGVDYTRVRLQVNDTFPWILGAAMLPCLIDVLPPLPPELQYRMVDDQLVLIDVHASLIVDVLPYALAELTVRNVRPSGDAR